MWWNQASFVDRADAGRQLAQRLEHLRGQDLVVLGLPRGGVPVAFEVARSLAAPLDVLVVRKLGVPEVAIGGVGDGGVLVRDDDALRFRQGRPCVPLPGRTALIVDDGIATGATARAACRIAWARGAGRVVLAVPACSPRTARLLGREVDELVVLQTPQEFNAVGQVYADFRPVPDDEVVALLHRATIALDASRARGSARAGVPAGRRPAAARGGGRVRTWSEGGTI